MSDIVEKVRIEADGSQAKKESSDVEKRLGQMFDKSALKAVAFNQALALGTQALGGLVDFMKKGIGAALQYERTTKQLSTTLSSLGDTSGRWVGILQNQSAELQRLTGISDETIRQYQIMALNAGASSDEVDKLLRASVSLSNAFGMELGSSIKNLIKTQAGLTGELGEAIPWIRDLTKEQLRAGDAIDLVNDRLGDQLTVMTEGTAGAAVSLSNAWADLGEEIGKFATLGPAVSMMQSIADALNLMARGVAMIREADPEALLKAYAASLTAPVTGIFSIGLAAAAAGTADGSAGGSGMLPLEPLVKPQAVGGSPKKRGNGAGGGITFGEDFGGAFGAGGDAIFVEGVGFISQAEYTASQNVRYDLEADLQQKLQDFRMGQLEHFASIEEQKTTIAQQQAEMRAKVEQTTMGKTAQVAVQTTQQIIGGIEAFAQGGVLGAVKYGASMAQAFGMQSIASGTAHEALAASMAFIPGMQGAAAALAAAATNEIAVGTALAAGGAIAGAGIGLGEKAASGGFSNFNVLTGGGGGGGGGGGVGGGSGSIGQFHAATLAEIGITGGGPQTGKDLLAPGGGDIHIHLEGPVYDGPSAGVAIMEKINEARQQGLG